MSGLAYRFMAWAESRRRELGLSREALAIASTVADDRIRYLERQAPESLRVVEADALAQVLRECHFTEDRRMALGFILADLADVTNHEETP